MAKQKEKQPNVKFITSVAIAVNDVNDVVQHLQLTVCQDVDTLDWKVFFDVVDPTKVPRFEEK